MGKRKPDTYNRSRQMIISRLLQSPTISDKDWKSDLMGRHTPKKGDLVSLSCARASKWQLSWYIESERPDGWCDDRHLLMSIEDHSLCWWTNVGFSIYAPVQYGSDADKPWEAPDQWMWTDRQFKFSDKWFRACDRQDHYSVVALYPTFSDEDYSVELMLRQKWAGIDGNDWTFKQSFDDWRKVKVKDMVAMHKSAVEDFSDYLNEQRKLREAQS